MDAKQGIRILNMQKEKAIALTTNKQISNAEYGKWKNTTEEFLIKVFTVHSVNVRTFKSKEPKSSAYRSNLISEHEFHINSLDYYVHFLESCIEQLVVDLDEVFDLDKEHGSTHINTINKKKVFVVHGRNTKIRESMFNFLRSVGVEPIEWLEAKKLVGSGTPFIGEVLEKAFNSAQAIIVLLTPDDMAYLHPDFQSERDELFEKTLSAQARPNVIFEAGMAIGAYEKRTIILEFGKLRPFSDVSGRHMLRFNDSSQSRHELVTLLKESGVEVNVDGKQDWLTIGDFALEPQKDFHINVEGFRSGTLNNEVAIRFVNNSSNKVEFKTCNINFVDGNNVRLIADASGMLKKKVYPFENRVEFFRVDGELDKFNQGDFKTNYDVHHPPVYEI